MIQRIQSIFLFLAAACGFGTLFLPLATTLQPEQTSLLFSDAQYTVNDHIALLLLFGLAGLLAMVSIFFFNNRTLQQKLGIFAIIANVLGIVMVIVLLLQDDMTMDASLIKDGAGAYLPLAFIAFGILALRFIRKDEQLIRSMDRLR